MSADTETQAGRTKRRILIVDDHPIVREGLAALIAHEPDMDVCGGAADATETLRQVSATRPDLVVVDISLKDGHGIDLMMQMKARHERIKMLVWSMFDEKLFAERALCAGASGYLNKQESTDHMVDAIPQVLQGEIYLSARMTRQLLRRVGGGAPSEADPMSNLSNRELQVLDMIGHGMTTRQIAHRLDLSPKTIESHREKIKRKLNLKNSAQLGRRAAQWVLERG